MKKMKLWMLAALLTIGGAIVFTACKDGDEGGLTVQIPAAHPNDIAPVFRITVK